MNDRFVRNLQLIIADAHRSGNGTLAGLLSAILAAAHLGQPALEQLYDAIDPHLDAMQAAVTAALASERN